MSRCPFAIWHPLGGNGGSFTGGPYKIVHHTTEGSSAAGAFSALRSAHAESHFVVDQANVYQLIDTAYAARSLRNKSGGVQTNRDSAIQIETVGFAGKMKNRATLANVAKLCRWLEAEYNIPSVWPAGKPPRTSHGPFPRDVYTWDSEGGHFGHSQVPENTHWDPAYVIGADGIDECDIVVPPHGIPVVVIPPAPLPPIPVITRVRVANLKPGDILNLREQPNAGSRDIGDLPSGLILDKLGEEGGWTEVRTPYYGVHGWAASRYLVPA